MVVSNTHGTGQLGDVNTPNSLLNVSSNTMHSQPALTALTTIWTVSAQNNRKNMYNCWDIANDISIRNESVK